MNALFPIKYFYNRDDCGDYGISAIPSTTIPFCYDNKWFAITQEDQRTTRTYTINMLQASPAICMPVSSPQHVNFTELTEIIKFMMNAAVEHQQRIANHNRHKVGSPSSLGWIELPLSGQLTSSTNSVVNTKPLVLHYDRSTSTSDLKTRPTTQRIYTAEPSTSSKCDCGTQVKAVHFNLDLYPPKYQACRDSTC